MSENKKGFTLIELLVVVLIIGILAAIALPQYKKVVWKTRFAEVLITLNALEKSAESYLLAHPNITETVTFTPEELDIESLSNLTEKTLWAGQMYCSKYACYNVRCFSDGRCSWAARFFVNTSDTSDANTITEMFGNFSTRWSRSCYYEGGTEYIGKPLCESTNWNDIQHGF